MGTTMKTLCNTSQITKQKTYLELAYGLTQVVFLLFKQKNCISNHATVLLEPLNFLKQQHEVWTKMLISYALSKVLHVSQRHLIIRFTELINTK